MNLNSSSTFSTQILASRTPTSLGTLAGTARRYFETSTGSTPSPISDSSDMVSRSRLLDPFSRVINIKNRFSRSILEAYQYTLQKQALRELNDDDLFDFLHTDLEEAIQHSQVFAHGIKTLLQVSPQRAEKALYRTAVIYLYSHRSSYFIRFHALNAINAVLKTGVDLSQFEDVIELLILISKLDRAPSINHPAFKRLFKQHLNNELT